MKYDRQLIVSAVYTSTPGGDGNPLLEAMPPMLDKEMVTNALAYFPQIIQNTDLTLEERLTYLTMLSTYFQPMDYMYTIYSSLYRAIRTTYISQTMLESIRTICSAQSPDNGPQMVLGKTTQGESGSILGVPGVGKTSTVLRCLNLMPQVIEHTEYHGEVFYCKQIPWLFVDCPSDCSVKALAVKIISAIEKAIGGTLLHASENLASNTMASLTQHVRVACCNYHIGLIVIDEIQNVVNTSQRMHQKTPLIQFLLELTNFAGTAIWMVGTPVAEEIFTAKDHLKRRTRGMRLLPFKKDGAYRHFLETLWQFQYTLRHAVLTDALANLLYDRTGGIPAYLVQLFRESQGQAILTGKPCISVNIINETARLLSIQVPRSYADGTSISDIMVPNLMPSKIKEMRANKHQECTTRRGRKPACRDEKDLLALSKKECSLLESMRLLDMVEVV